MALSVCAEPLQFNESAAGQLQEITKESELNWVKIESVRFTNNFLSLRNASTQKAATGDKWAGSVIYIEFNDDDEAGNGSDDDWAGQADSYWQQAVLRKRVGPRVFLIEYVDEEGDEDEESDDNEEAHADDNTAATAFAAAGGGDNAAAEEEEEDDGSEAFATVEFCSQPSGTLRIVSEGPKASTTVHAWRGCSSLAQFLNEASPDPSGFRTMDPSQSPASTLPSLALFDGALSVEDRAYQDGVRDGKQKTYSEKFAEGSEFGTRHGFADAFEVGSQAGFSDVVSRLILPRVAEALGERVAAKAKRNAEKLASKLKDFPVCDAQAEDRQNLRQSIKMQATLLSKKLQLGGSTVLGENGRWGAGGGGGGASPDLSF